MQQFREQLKQRACEFTSMMNSIMNCGGEDLPDLPFLPEGSMEQLRERICNTVEIVNQVLNCPI